MILQESFFQYFGKGYLALVSAIKTTQTKETTDLFNIILHIIWYAKINKRNKENMVENANKILATKTLQVPRGIYITQEYINRGIITYFFDQYQVKHLELWAKYSFCHMRMQRSNHSLRKTATFAEPEQKKTLAAPEIES